MLEVFADFEHATIIDRVMAGMDGKVLQPVFLVPLTGAVTAMGEGDCSTPGGPLDPS
ncbi:MAG TPA: hypothetical protein VND89_04460 [Acidimicrobiales bacterium]|nr:hypothetical protein [Acidimicrobiales bacterium]